MTRFSYLKAFARSSPHAVLAALTLGLGFASGHPLGLIAGATAYVLGWMFIGDSAWFRRRIDARQAEALMAQEEAAYAKLLTERRSLLQALQPAQRGRYEALAAVCQEIEVQLQQAGDTGFELSKLDGLMWSYLGLLGSEAHLATFIEQEGDEPFADSIASAEKDLAKLQASLVETEPGSPSHEARLQLIASRQEALEALRRRHQQFSRAGENLALVRAEQDRISQQLKLVRADLYASKSVGQMSQRINETLDTLSSSGRLGGISAPTLRELPSLQTRRLGYAPQSEG